MNRRDVLKALGALPIASALEGCMHGRSVPTPDPAKTKTHSLQILLEGAFAVVLQKQSHRITAFVPRPDPGRKDLAHHFYFNDPGSPQVLDERSKGYRFELPGEGLYRYSKPDEDPYVNPGFSDFSAQTEVWTLPPSIVILDLPFPRSINFSGRPLNVRFGPKALKPTGVMPTNFIFEYRVEDEKRVQLKCDQPGMQCSPSPHCPPGIIRYYFGVGPTMHDQEGRQKHAVEFFNFILSKSFPELREKYELAYIEPSDYEQPGESGSTRPVSFTQPIGVSSTAIPAVLGSAPPARLLPVASLVDCQSGGFLVSTRTPPIR
jgi:hypothetical protein